MGEFKKIIIDDVDSFEFVLVYVILEMILNSIVLILFIIYMFIISWRSVVVGFILIIIGIFVVVIMMVGGV